MSASAGRISGQSNAVPTVGIDTRFARWRRRLGRHADAGFMPLVSGSKGVDADLHRYDENRYDEDPHDQERDDDDRHDDRGGGAGAFRFG
jgi:hypothetical protein